MEEKRENKTHRKKLSGPKAERKKSKQPPELDLNARQRNPKAFSIQHANKTLKTVQRTQDLKTKKQHIPIVDRTPLEPPPIIVGVVGPPKVGKTTLLKCVVKNFTKQRLTRIQGPVTVVSGKQRRLTMIECNNDINSMIDIAKVADLVLLLVDASFGFEMETFEFLNICQVHGFPRIMGVLTHLDSFKDSKRLRKTKKRLKHRFWTEVYQGAKLFYLSGMVNGEYQKTEVHNLCRFISVMKFRPLTWRTTHPYVLADRMEDITDPEKVRQFKKIDRNISLYGYLHGTHMKNNTNIHIPGCGDFSIHDLQFLSDPCPTPDQNKKRSLSTRDRVVYAPMSGVGGIVYDKDAVYIDLGGSHSHHTDPQNMDDDDDDGPKVANELVASLMAMNNPVDKKMKSSDVSVYSEAIKKSDTAEQDEGYSEESVEMDGRVRRKAVFADNTNDDEDGEDSSDNDSSEDDDDDDEVDIRRVTKTLSKSRDENVETGIEFADTDDELEDSKQGVAMGDSGSDDDSDDDESDEDDSDDDEIEIKINKSDKQSKPQDDSDDSSSDDDDDSDDDDGDEIKLNESNNKKGEKVSKTVVKSSSKEKAVLDDKDNKSQSQRSNIPSGEGESDDDESSEEDESSDEDMEVDDTKSDKLLITADTVASLEPTPSKKPGKSLSEKLMNLSQKEYFSLNAKEKSHDDESEEQMMEDKKVGSQILDSTVNQLEGSTVGVSNDNNEGSMKWRHDLMSQAAASFRQRQSERINYRKLIYGKGDDNDNAAVNDDEEEDEIGGLFRVLKEKSEASSKDRAAINSTDCTKCQIQTLASIDVESIRDLIADCFVTGKWDENEDAEALLQKDDDLYGDFEDLETGEKHAGTTDTHEDVMKDDDDGDEDEEDNEKKPEEVKKKKADMSADERRDEKKRKLKEMFDTQYDMKGDTEFYDNWKEELDQQAKMNRSMFDDMDDETRVQYEGFRPGMYVRVEIQGVPCEFVTNFDATYPVILGGLLSVENNVGYVQTRMKKHRWHKKILKNKNPLIISLGWRRFQSIPLYFIQDHNMRNRMLKYTPQHLHCHATFWGPITPQGTGLLAVENVADTTADFRIAATGVVLELDKSQQIMKKLKLTGNPQKIYKKTAFVEGMFNSALEVAKFEGASVRTVSGVRGQIKKAAKSPEGAFRATFEDRILLSDIVFLRTWYPVEVPQFYNPVTTLLLPQSQKQGWTGLKTMGQLHREKHTKPTFSDDSVYKKIERKGKSYAPLSVPKALQKMLPFKDTPKSLVEKKESVKRVAIIREPHEAKIAKMVSMLKSVHEHKKRTEHAQMRERAQKHQKEKNES